MFCKKCGNELKENNRFCGKCGEPVPVTRVEAPAVQAQKLLCQKCGNQLNDGVKFCAKCGQPTALTEPATSPCAPVAQSAPAQPPMATNALSTGVAQLKKSLCSWFFIVAVVLYVILSIGRVATSLNEKPVDANDVFSILETEDADFDEVLDELEDVAYELKPAKVVANLLTVLPFGLISAGLIINVVQAHKKDSFATVGFKLIKSAMIIRILFAAVIISLALAVMWVVPTAVKEVLSEIAKEANSSELNETINTVKVITVASMCSVIAIQIVPILHSVFALTAAGDMQKLVKTEVATNKKYNGIQIMNGIYVTFNVIKLVFVVLIKVFADTIAEFIDDAQLFEGKVARHFEDIIESVLSPSLWAIISTALVIVVLTVFNKWISKYVRSKLDVNTFAQ